MAITNSVFYIFGAIVLFQMAVLFINGALAPTQLQMVYDHFPESWQRMLLVLLPLLGVGNLLVASAFQNAKIAFPAIMFFQVCAAGLTYCYIEKTWLSITDTTLLLIISVLIVVLAVRIS